MKKLFILLTFVFTSIIFLHAQSTQPEFKYSGKLRATNYLTIPAGIFPTTGDINGDTVPDLIVGTYYTQIYQYNFSLIFLYDRQNDKFTFYDTLRNADGSVLHGVKPMMAEFKNDDTLYLVINPDYNRNIYQIYKQISPNRFQLIDTLRDANNNVEPLDGPYTFFDANRDKKLDLYAVDFTNQLVYYENDSIYHYLSGYFPEDTTGAYIQPSPAITYLNFLRDFDYSAVTIDTLLYVSTQDSFIYAYSMIRPTRLIREGKLMDRDTNVIKVKNPRPVINRFYADTLYDMLLFRDYKAPIKYRQTNKGWEKQGYLPAENYFLQSFNYPDIFFYDVNKDGYEDAFMSDLYGHILVSLRDGKNNYFLLPDTLRTNGKPIEIGSTIHFAIGDLDGDGKDDLFIDDYDGNFLYYKQNTGYDFDFVDTIDKAGHDGRLTFAVGDFNVDNKKDLAISDVNGSAWLLDLSDGKLDTVLTFGLWNNFPSIAGGDINGDGYDDFVILYDVSYPKDNITFFLNDGHGNFTQTDNSGYGAYHVGHSNISIGMTDLDNDGKMDVVLSQINGSMNYWLNKTSTSSSGVSDAEFNINLYPNPVVDVLHLGITSTQPIIYQITDLQARVVKQGKMTATNSVDVNSLTPGVYVIRLRANSKVYTSKFVKL